MKRLITRAGAVLAAWICDLTGLSIGGLEQPALADWPRGPAFVERVEKLLGLNRDRTRQK